MSLDIPKLFYSDIPKLFHGTSWYRNDIDPTLHNDTTISYRLSLYRQLCDWGKPRWVCFTSAPNYVKEHMGSDMQPRLFDHFEFYKLKHTRFGGRCIWVTIASPYYNLTESKLAELGYMPIGPVYSRSAISYMRVLMVPEVGDRYVMFSPGAIHA